MADLDFSHHVSEIPAGQPLPDAIARKTSTAVTPFPDIQGAVSEYAASSNWMSSIGSYIAGTASNQIASQLGSEVGKNPKGTIGLPITDFDKTMLQSYQTQAHATLGLQADKLISDSNLEASKANRITPSLIDKTNNSISIGLQNIFKNAPAEIRPSLESQYGRLQIGQLSDMSERMFREQKQDRINNTQMASQMNSEHAYSFGLNGDDEGGLAAIETTSKLNEADVSARLITPEAAKTNIDTARKSYLSGKIIHDYEKARAEGKDQAYLKSIADKKPDYLSDQDYDPVVRNLLQYINLNNSLRTEDEQLRVTKFYSSIAQNVNDPTIPQQLADLKANISPLAFEKAQFKYNQYLKGNQGQEAQVFTSMSAWGNPEMFARTNANIINRTFDRLVSSAVQNGERDGHPISEEEAQVQVAASAGAPVPVFVDSLNKDALSGNPAYIQSAANKIHLLREMKAGTALQGLSKKAEVITTQFQNQRGSMPDNDLARKLTDNLSNVDQTKLDTLNNAWNMQLSARGAGGLSGSKPLYKLALDEVGLKNENLGHGYHDENLGGGFFDVLYGNDLYDQLNSNFIASGGDYDAALSMTKNYYKEHYGETRVNGDIRISDSPIEKYLGYEDPEVVPTIQQDMLNQFSVKFEKNKDPNDYWTVQPLKPSDSHYYWGKKYPAAEVVRHTQTRDGIKEYRYPVNLVGRPGNQWDVMLKTTNGYFNIFQVAPHLGINTYKPDVDWIHKHYKQSQKGGL